jgi:hypothetical protein
VLGKLRHVAYAGGWKKLEPLWDWVIRAKWVSHLLPTLEAVLSGWGAHPVRENPVSESGPVASTRIAPEAPLRR